MEICFLDVEDEDFMESNKMHQINGYMYGNLKGLEFCKEQSILWHTFVIGTEVDMHAIYFHGNTFESAVGNRKDSLVLFPGTRLISVTSLPFIAHLNND